VRCEGVNLFLADGEAAMQEVFHSHLHVFPRYRGDGFGLKFPPGYADKPGREELDAIAEKIRDSSGRS
jgi:histidine triad (HIT) family protein